MILAQTALRYDDFGRLLTTSRTGTASLGSRWLAFGFRYETAGTSTGHVQSITYPSGNRVDITYGSDGRPSSLSFDAPDKAAPVILIKDIAYRPFGDVVSWSWGNSTVTKPNFYGRRKNWIPFAPALANRLGVPVTAPLEFSRFSANTGMLGAAGPSRRPNPGSIGRWKTFYPYSSASKQ